MSQRRGPTQYVLWAAIGLLPALSLSIPSGYSVGSLMLVGLGLAHLFRRDTAPHWDASLTLFACATAAMGSLWVLDMLWREPFVLNGLDRPLKYALALLAIPALTRGLPTLAPLKWGIWFGAWGAACTAAWQTQVLNWDRAWGYTNAIPFGDTALLLGMWSWVWARTTDHKPSAWFGHSAALAGSYACLASGSRGAWLTAPVLVALVVWQTRRAIGIRVCHWAVVVSLVMGGMALGALWPQVQSRINLATQEIRLYTTTQQSDTSIGQRLTHWQLAWDMGFQRPWLGWGQIGYEGEKLRRVEAGETPNVVLPFGHAHQEWLDMWVKKGLLGLVILAAFLLGPGWFYAKTLCGFSQAPVYSERSAAALCGALTVVGYVGFGMTQVMFAHNSSTLVYLFMNLVWLAALLPIQPPAHDTPH
ncbi:MAG: O-antigen ligase family protein [Burkholderiaceae bacterium]